MQSGPRRMLIGLGLALGPWIASATPPETAAAPASPETAVPATAPANPLGLKPLDERALATKRGGMDSVSEAKLKGVVADNQASNLVTGGNTISEGAFAGAAGVPVVIQNSGNNVLIQNATIVNVQVK